MNTCTFLYQGRQITLRARSSEPGAPLYLAFQRKGRRFLRSLETPAKAQAVTKAKLILESIEANNLDAARKLLARPGVLPVCSIGQVIAWAETAPLGINETTRAAYINCLRNVLRRGTGSGGDVDKLRADVMNPQLVRALYRDAVARSAAAKDQEEAGRIKRSANSILNQARSLFSARNVGDMKDAGLVLPDLRPFHEEIEARWLKGTAKEEWHAPSEAVVVKTVRAWRALGKEVRSQKSEVSADLRSPTSDLCRNTFLAVWLELSCGLRAGEVTQAQWEWFTVRDGRTVLDGAATVKNKTGRIRVTPLEPYFSWGRQAAAGDQTGSILTGSLTEVRDDVFRRVSELLRECGWETTKTNHALRALAGAWVVKRTRSIYEAQKFLRHKSVAVTEQNYGYLVK